MKLIPIPDELVPNAVDRITLGAPKGYEKDCAPAEVLMDKRYTPEQIRCLVQLEDGDLEKIQENGGRFWLNFWGRAMPPTMLCAELEAFL